MKRLHPLVGSTNPAGQVVLQCNWDIQCLHRCIVYQVQTTEEDGVCGMDTVVSSDEAVVAARVGSGSLPALTWILRRSRAHVRGGKRAPTQANSCRTNLMCLAIVALLAW